jgi:hypothetical protein
MSVDLYISSINITVATETVGILSTHTPHGKGKSETRHRRVCGQLSIYKWPKPTLGTGAIAIHQCSQAIRFRISIHFPSSIPLLCFEHRYSFLRAHLDYYRKDLSPVLDTLATRLLIQPKMLVEYT